MKTLIALASLVLLVGVVSGCGDDTTTMTADMTVGADMHAPAGDMAKMNCGQLLTCVQGCTDQTCLGTCAAGASTAAATKAGALGVCIAGACGMVDGGTGACTSTADTSAGCVACEQGAVIGACNTQYAACQSDM